VNCQRRGGQLDKIRAVERGNDRPEVLLEERDQFPVGDVSSGDDQQLLGRLAQEVTVTEVAVLRDDNSVVGIGEVRDLIVGRPFPAGRSSV
jgi:hypothetical protein